MRRQNIKSSVRTVSLTIIVLFILSIINPVFAVFGDVSNVTVDGDALNIFSGTDQLIVQVCKPDLLKVDYRPGGSFSEETPMINPDKVWTKGNITSIDIVSDPMVITTSKMVVKITKIPFRISVYDISGNLLIKEADEGGVYIGGVNFTHNPGDNFYGIYGYSCGANSSAGLLRNNGGSVAAGNQGGCGAPFVWSTNGYGVLVDSDGGAFSIDSTKLNYSGVSKKNTEYFIMVGNPEDIMISATDITGKAPMFPKWATGFTNTEWGISESELNTIVDTYRSKRIPIDNYCLDFDWKAWGQNNYGEFTWNTTKFPGAASMTLKTVMDAKGIKLSGIQKPRIHTGTVQANDVTNGGWWLPGSSAYTDYSSQLEVKNVDFSKAGLRAWWWSHMKSAYDKGLQGYWNDEVDVNFPNLHGLYMQKAMFDGQRSYANKRVWSINRNFYLGAQRYAYGLWSGDIGSSFDIMAAQRERMLSAVNLGEAKWGMDSGGFNGTPSSELYARWIEFSAFTPMFRVHGQNNQQRQPWEYGSVAEEAAKKIMQFRYTLIPYVYAYDRQAYETGIGLVKPLAFAYPDDINVANYKDAWMFGDYFLVSPVMKSAQTSKSIYLPAGTWIDYSDGTIYAGEQYVTLAVDSTNWDDVPLFIKKGAIIPTQDFMNYVGEKPVSNIYLDVFPDTEETSFNYYDDDGNTYDYENGSYFKQTITSLYAADSETLNIGAKSGAYTPELQYYITKVHMTSNAPVTVDGQPVTKYGSYTELLNANGEGWTAGADTYGNVVYIKVAAGNEKNIVIPGTIPDPPSPPKPVFIYEAENAVISGGAGINSNHSGYSGDGFVDGYQNSGATTTFNVNVSTAGSYLLDLRYANATGAVKTVSIYINGVKLKSAAFPNLSNWDTWSNAVEQVTLNSGSNAITYKYDSGDTGNINLDYIILTSLDAEPPTAPEGLKSTGKSGSTVNLSWMASTDNMGIGGYKIYRDGKAVNSRLVTDTAYTDTGLIPDTSYTYYVKAVDASGNESVASETISVTTDPPDTLPPTAPGDLRNTGKTGSTVSLSWTASNDNVGVSGYTVYRNGTAVNSKLITDTSYTDTGLIPNTTYTYYVTAKDGAANESATSSMISVTTNPDSQGPTAPGALTSTGKTANSISLSWIASTDNVSVAGYTIYRDGTAVNSTLITETIYTDNGLSPGKTYSYYVKATDAAGNQSQASNTITAATDSLGSKTTIYYKRGYSTPYIHYTQADGNWTTPPGVPMKDCGDTYSGYSVINDIDMGTNTTLQACFNNGSGAWDNNGGKNYIFSPGTYTIANGIIYEGPPKSVQVTFTVNNAYTMDGQNVYITGNIAELGNWAPASAAGPALCPNYPTWTLTAALPAGQAIEFKAIKKDGAGKVIWESGGNHRYTVPASDTGSVSIDWQN